MAIDVAKFQDKKTLRLNLISRLLAHVAYQALPQEEVKLVPELY